MGEALTKEEERARDLLQRRVRTKAEIKPDQYKIDLELLDRYVQYSAEILRLALASLAAVGFVASLLIKDNPPLLRSIAANTCAQAVAAIGVMLICFSAAFALAHRYCATDGFSDYARALREIAASRYSTDERVDQKLDERNKYYTCAKWCLRMAALTLALGVICLGAGALILL
jgi:hypothetical protein